MEETFHNKLKFHLVSILVHEGDEGAWKLLKTLEPNRDELKTLILKNRYADEAWELYKKLPPEKSELMCLIRDSAKQKEAAAFLLEHGTPDTESLAAMVCYAHSDEAARILLDQNPDKYQLYDIMEYTNLSDEAALYLLNRNPDNDGLKRIMQDSGLKQEAWEKLLQQSPSNEDLISVVFFTDLEELAWQQLLKQGPSNEELVHIVHNFSETGRKRREAAELVLKQEPDTEHLIALIENEQLADEAWELMKKKNPHPDDLEHLIRRSKVKVNEAAELSLKGKPGKYQLLEILDYSDRKEEAAAQLVKMPLRIKDLVAVILATDNTRAVELLIKKTGFDRSQVDEQQLIRDIKARLLTHPELLNVNHWHDGESHCFGGWAITLCEAGRELEKHYSPEVAACLLLPQYAHLFYADKETVLAELKNV